LTITLEPKTGVDQAAPSTRDIQLPSARHHALELQSPLNHDYGHPATGAFCPADMALPPPRPRSAITIHPDNDAAAILRRVPNEPFVDDHGPSTSTAPRLMLAIAEGDEKLSRRAEDVLATGSADDPI
jgi:hypothetical protein